MKKIILASVLLLSLPGFSQELNKTIMAGNDFYRKQQYNYAESQYQMVLHADTSNVIAKYNMANTAYKLGRQGEAMRVYNELSGHKHETPIRSKAYYNHGAVLIRQKRLEESIEAWKNTLRLDPNDKEARENLQKALLELKKKEPPKKQEKQKNQEKKPQPQQPKMNRNEAEQRLKLLEQKEKEVLQRMQKSKAGGNQQKDW